jgi:tetratricopeptide (TPR) repeat protein
VPCLTLLERPAETEPIYYDLLSRSPKPVRHMNVSYALAILYTRVYGPEHKDHRRALAHVNTAIAIASLLEDPADQAFHTVFMNNGKALVEMHLGHLAESLRLVSEGIARLDGELPPDKHRLHRSVLYHNRAQVLAALGRPDEALADFDHVIEADPNYPEYHFDRGNLFSKMGRHAEALADYEAAMRLSPPFPELYYNRGDLRAASGDLEGAISDFGYVLDLEPDHLDARVSLASLLLDAGDPKAAVAQIVAGLAVTPHEARLHCTLGLALLDLADHQAAREAFDRAHELDPDLSEALVNRAVAAYELGQYDLAVTDLSTALEADPGHPDLLYNRGFAHEAAGRPQDAVADYTLALQDARADRAAVLYRRGRCHAALAEFAAAHDDLDAHLALGGSPYQQEINDLLKSCRQAAHRQPAPAQG